MAKAKRSKYTPQPRNNALMDKWSFVHAGSSFVLTLLLGPLLTLLIVTLWEPFEIFIVSPILKRFGIVFGHESLRNSLSDIVFNTVGVGVATFIFNV